MSAADSKKKSVDEMHVRTHPRGSATRPNSLELVAQSERHTRSILVAGADIVCAAAPEATLSANGVNALVMHAYSLRFIVYPCCSAKRGMSVCQ